MPRPAFIVDGLTERNVIKALCDECPIQITNLNGNTVTIEAVAKKIASLIRLLSNRNHPIVIIVDREERSESCQDMEKCLRDGLKREGISDDQVVIGIPDRMIENWLLADWGNFKRVTGLASSVVKPEGVEGSKGKSLVRKHYPAYHGPTHAHEILRKSDPRKVVSNSNSFKLFFGAIRGRLPCSWISKG